MKKVEIREFSFAEVDAPKEQFGFLKIPSKHTLIRAEGENLEVSDGYHTFGELYEHRITLFIKLCVLYQKNNYYKSVWKSKLHSDGSSFDGWFILGINKEKSKQITYHLPMDKWDITRFADELEKAPEWDGHTSNDVLERIKLL
jgi:hypothetical protein